MLRKLTMAAAAACLVAGLGTAGTMGAKADTKAPAVTVQTATQWYYWQVLKAYSGGGCAAWNRNPPPGGVLYSAACTSGTDHSLGVTEMQYRIINGQYLQVGYVDSYGSFDLTVVSGRWEWEPANDNLVFTEIPTGDGYDILYQDGDHFMGPNGYSLPLKDITPSGTEADAGWLLETCPGSCQ